MNLNVLFKKCYSIWFSSGHSLIKFRVWDEFYSILARTSNKEKAVSHHIPMIPLGDTCRGHFALAVPLRSSYTICIPASNELSFCCSTFSSAFGVIRVLDFDHSVRYVVAWHYCFNLNFPNGIWYSIFFSEVSDKIFSLIFNLGVFFIVESKSSSYMFNNYPL